jgi:DNA uptake protein ComE-like DNA-binding protein
MRIHALILGLVLPMLVSVPAFAQGTTAPAVTTPATRPAATAPAELIDINSATAAQLEPLKGIGPVRAAAIVKGRPYKGKDELVEKKIIPKNVYDDIKDRIIAKQK